MVDHGVDSRDKRQSEEHDARCDPPGEANSPEVLLGLHARTHAGSVQRGLGPELLARSTASELVPDCREDQAGGPPHERERRRKDVPDEVPDGQIPLQASDDADGQPDHDSEPEQRVGPNWPIEERTWDHRHMITRCGRPHSAPVPTPAPPP